MKFYQIFSLSIILALTACAPQSTALYYKKGMVLSSRQRDYDACKIKSFKEIPQNIVTEYNPGYYDPGRLSCYTIGYSTQCNRVGAIDIPATTSHHDENLNMRARFLNDCMSKKGYEMVELMFCNNVGMGYNQLNKAPELSSIDCIDPASPEMDY